MFNEHYRDYLVFAAPMPHREAIAKLRALTLQELEDLRISQILNRFNNRP